MKSAKLIPILLVTLALGFYGCKKSNPAPQNLLTYTLNGNKYSLPSPQVTINGGDLHMYGRQGDLVENIILSNYQKGSHDVLADGQIILDVDNTEAGMCNFTQGTVVVSSLTQTHISGTFSGTVVTYINNSPVPVTGTFDADIPQ